MANLDTFNTRIGRINRGKQWAPDGVVHSPIQAQRRRGPQGSVARFFHTVSLPFAFALGLLAMAVVRFARMKFSGVPLSGNVLVDTLMIDAVIALVLAFILVQIVSMRSVGQLFVAVAGVGTAALGMHLVVHRAPDIFAQFFGATWVNAVLTQTPSDTVLFAYLIDRLPV